MCASRKWFCAHDMCGFGRKTVSMERPMDPTERAAWLIAQPPPEATLAWLVDELDVSAVVEVSQMHGGSTAAMHRVRLIDRRDNEREVVLRRYVRAEIVSETPDVAEVEARALQLVEQLPMPTPVLLALDPTGDHGDAPALVMTLLDGRPVWENRWGDKWVSQAVDAMIACTTSTPPTPSCRRCPRTRRSVTTRRAGRTIQRCGSEPSSCSTAPFQPATSGSFTVTSTRATCSGSDNN